MNGYKSGSGLQLLHHLEQFAHEQAVRLADLLLNPQG
eukprot:CAMPEP_0184653250 /NCGR_PEP_ID=MMETSP0308-20130426/10989_1 /TAXON_ID=38269 /ORGANISM="Gloeochaete witrockiana, Strain SAG 46.84" /LENGTH=36 /DNA_ID= /DNA_START= /DNA_END= /DNA_ORIENTATION=